MKNNFQKLHLACGSVHFSSWLNVDLDSPTADLQLDLAKPLPFEDASITHIFSEHFIEHISRPDAVSFLGECRRVLKDNGVIRLSTPNLRFLIATYIAETTKEWGELWEPDSPCSLMNEAMRSWGHQHVYDSHDLVSVLLEAGFSSISFQEYRKSQDKVLCNLETRPFHFELIIEARKTHSSTQSIDYQAIELVESQWSVKLENELVARIHTAEKMLEDQANHFKSVEAESAARGEVITQLQQAMEDQANHFTSVESESAARGELITQLQQSLADQANHLRLVKSELLKFQHSFCGKTRYTISRIVSIITSR